MAVAAVVVVMNRDFRIESISLAERQLVVDINDSFMLRLSRVTKRLETVPLVVGARTVILMLVGILIFNSDKQEW